jgi:hypothetical protein
VLQSNLTNLLKLSLIVHEASTQTSISCINEVFAHMQDVFVRGHGESTTAVARHVSCVIWSASSSVPSGLLTAHDGSEATASADNSACALKGKKFSSRMSRVRAALMAEGSIFVSESFFSDVIQSKFGQSIEVRVHVLCYTLRLMSCAVPRKNSGAICVTLDGLPSGSRNADCRTGSASQLDRPVDHPVFEFVSTLHSCS